MKTEDLFEYDRAFLPETVAGVDEVGRGPLAGPVVCACVIMPLDRMIDGVNDSKKLSEKKRERLYDLLRETALSYSVAELSPAVIDEMNIYQATKLCMKKAIEGLKIKPSLVLVDAMKDLDVSVPCKAIIKGDAQSYNIAAASIIAKVYRDRIMREMDVKYPQYGFASNKGYGTGEHIRALKTYGKTEIHRDTFIKNIIGGNGS